MQYCKNVRYPTTRLTFGCQHSYRRARARLLAAAGPLLLATRFSLYADTQKIDAARSLVARIHGGVADVVNYEWQRVLLGISSAHPHALQHGAVVEVGHVDASVGACTTLNNMCLERWARRHLYDCRSHDRYLDLVNAASYANMAENDSYNHGNQMCCGRAASVAPHPLPF